MPSVYPSMAPTFTSFSTAGSYSWVVPSGVTAVEITLRGASGGGFGCTSSGSANGGFGGIVSASLIVNPGATLSINVGGQGGTDTGVGGFNGGGKGSVGGCSGSGGGGTDIRTTAGALSTRVVAAFGAIFSSSS